MQRTFFAIRILFFLNTSIVFSQITVFPYRENFDAVAVPNLPVGWATTTNKSAGGDFTTSTTAFRSSPHAASSTDATKSQSLVSLVFNFAGKFVDLLEFYERRTSTHIARVLVEASINDDALFGVRISPDSLRLVSSTVYVRRAFVLPDTLSGKTNVRFRIRIVADTSGVSGVYRIDDVRLTVKKAVDLAVSSISFSPTLPKKGDQLSVTVGITNRALAGIFSGTVQLFDSLTHVASQNFLQQFQANDSLTVVLNYPNIKSGRHPLTAKLLLNGDEDTTNNSLSRSVFAGFLFRSLLVNEIMYTPTDGKEWVEIINTTNDTIDIAQWKISDRITSVLIASTSTSLLPKQYGIIARDTTFKDNFPNFNGKIFRVSNLPTLNNDSDAVVLIDPVGFSIDSVLYRASWGGLGGKSLERIDTALASTLQSNWKTSVHQRGATPGAINSVSKKEFDVSVERISVLSQFPVIGDQLTVSSVVKNIGKQHLSVLNFQLFVDANKDSVLEAGELKFEQNISILNANDSATIQTTPFPLPQGAHWLFAKISTSQYDDTTNNILFFSLTVGIPRKSIVINEIMYAPAGDMPEWIEGYNTTTSSIIIGGWRISDNGSTKALIQNVQAVVLAQSYFIVTTDTNQFKNIFPGVSPLYQAAIPTLNNTTPDAVVVFDERGATMDSVYYKQAWGGTNGNSLQRYDVDGVSTDSSNWRSTPPTPAVQNSITRKTFDARVRRVLFSPRFPMIEQTITVNAAIENIGKQAMNSITVEFYLDANNDSIAATNELKSQQVIPSIAVLDSNVVSAQFFADRSGPQRIFVKIISANDEELANNTVSVPVTVVVVPQSIVVTEIMYSPPSDIPEWVEFYNRSTLPVSIAGWKMSDNGTTKTTITNSVIPIPPQSYFILAADSSFLIFHTVAVPVFIASFSSLNNTTPDAVVLFDSQNRMIDSVYYKQAWGGANGNSLQRFDIFSSSTDSANWKSAMPNAGVENSIARKDFDVEMRRITSTNTSNGTRVSAIIFNVGRQTATAVNIKFFHDVNNDSIAHTNEFLFLSQISTLAPLDSAADAFNWNVSLQGKHFIIVSAEFALDQRVTNNAAIVSIAKNYHPQTFVINEIMYEPLKGNAEFVELLNRSTDTIDIADWKLMDQPSSSGARTIVPLSKMRLLVPPNRFFIVASDSSLFTQFPVLDKTYVAINTSLSLNNSGEDLVLVDLTNTQIDSVQYSPSWHLKNISSAGRSLERINPSILSNDARNWSSSVSTAGATPAVSNSIFTKSTIQNSSLNLSPNPFSPDNDGFEDFLSINYSLPANSTTIRVRIFDVTGRMIRRLAQNELSPSTGSIIWNGMDDDGNRVRIGMYIVLFEALDNFGGTAKTMKDVAVVARKL